MKDNTINEQSQADLAIVESLQPRLYLDPQAELLLKPLKPIKVTIEIDEPDEELNKDKGPMDIHETKRVKREVELDYQKGIVLKVDANTLKARELGNITHNYAPGDTVIYLKRYAKEFGLIKNTILVRPVDIVGKWSGK